MHPHSMLKRGEPSRRPGLRHTVGYKAAANLQDAALVRTLYAMSKKEMYLACWDREFILVRS